jgi:riboflavin synthase
VDVVARYVERLIGGQEASRIDEAFLKKHGFS